MPFMHPTNQSMLFRMAKKNREPRRKKRNEYIYGTTAGDVTEIVVNTDPATGEISFGQEMTDVYSEVTYDRPKGEKVLSRLPQRHPERSFDASVALKKNYDFVCAVDTNTKRIQGKLVSVVAVVRARGNTLPEPDGLNTYWKFDIPFCLEYVGLRVEKPENFGWMEALRSLKARNFIDKSMRIGLIVDSDLGRLKAFNTRKEPVDRGQMLPDKVQLIYASADSGRENILNVVLGRADLVASDMLTRIETGAIPFNQKLADNPHFERERRYRIRIAD